MAFAMRALLGRLMGEKILALAVIAIATDYRNKQGQLNYPHKKWKVLAVSYMRGSSRTQVQTTIVCRTALRGVKLEWYPCMALSKSRSGSSGLRSAECSHIDCASRL